MEISEATLQGAETPLRVHGLRGDFRRIAARHTHGTWPADLVQVGEILPAVPGQPGLHSWRGVRSWSPTTRGTT